MVELNNLSEPALKEELAKCCGSKNWVNKIAASFPFTNVDELFAKAEQAWYECSEQDWLEAFTHHPKIGDANSLKEKFASTSHLASTEQAGVNSASDTIISELAEYNKKYEEKFGYIFIVCATGKSAGDMLHLLKQRYKNDPATEIKIAMKEQNYITKIRLKKLLA
ncbi:MAG: uraD [Segetibacter sp.]|nr:uraD [Segetibacter sp.]